MQYLLKLLSTACHINVHYISFTLGANTTVQGAIRGQGLNHQPSLHLKSTFWATSTPLAAAFLLYNTGTITEVLIFADRDWEWKFKEYSVVNITVCVKCQHWQDLHRLG